MYCILILNRYRIHNPPPISDNRSLTPLHHSWDPNFDNYWICCRKLGPSLCESYLWAAASRLWISWKTHTVLSESYVLCLHCTPDHTSRRTHTISYVNQLHMSVCVCTKWIRINKHRAFVNFYPPNLVLNLLQFSLFTFKLYKFLYSISES